MDYRAVFVGFVLAAALVMGADAEAHAAGVPDYVEFTVHDIARSKTFYGAVFGWTFTDYVPGYTSFNAATMGGGFTTDGPVKTGGGPLIVFSVPDIDATFGKAKAAGAEIVKPIFTFPGGRRFQMKDPDGYEIAVWSGQ
jgi:predicted enzyme related to lactoylglutathione lyase